jgi:hypothetical protein
MCPSFRANRPASTARAKGCACRSGQKLRGERSACVDRRLRWRRHWRQAGQFRVDYELPGRSMRGRGLQSLHGRRFNPTFFRGNGGTMCSLTPTLSCIWRRLALGSSSERQPQLPSHRWRSHTHRKHFDGACNQGQRRCVEAFDGMTTGRLRLLMRLRGCP